MSHKIFPEKIILNHYSYLVVRPEHYQLLHTWLNAPHVAKHWDGAVSMSEVIGKYDQKLHAQFERAYMVKLAEKFVGYISVYFVTKVGGGWWMEEDDETVGVDLFLGEEALLGQGLGIAYLKAFSDWLLEQKGISRVITDPASTNLRAIKAYEKAGFRKSGLVTTPDGEAMLLEKGKDI